MGVLQLENETERKRGLKRITEHSAIELNTAIKKAVNKYGDDFWILLHGIDAYMERRKRRHKRLARIFEIPNSTAMLDFPEETNWGDDSQ